jgi:ribosomal protein L40E
VEVRILSSAPTAKKARFCGSSSLHPRKKLTDR